MSSTPPPSYDELNVQESSNENQTEDETKMTAMVNQDSSKKKHVKIPLAIEKCSMCFEEFKNKSYPISCWHAFCFDCLKNWALKYLNSVLGPICPVCNRSFQAIQHSLKNNDSEFELYKIPIDTNYGYKYCGNSK